VRDCRQCCDGCAERLHPSGRVGVVDGRQCSGTCDRHERWRRYRCRLTKYIEATEIFDPYKVCALTPVVSDTYVGMDRKVQDDIARTMRTLEWRVDAVSPDDRRILAQSVLYEACDDRENRGAAVLVTDAQTSEILLFERIGVFTSNRSPIWTAFLTRPEPGAPDAPLFTFSHCTECGAATAVYYDVTRKKLYTVYNGH